MQDVSMYISVSIIISCDFHSYMRIRVIPESDQIFNIYQPPTFQIIPTLSLTIEWEFQNQNNGF